MNAGKRLYFQCWIQWHTPMTHFAGFNLYSGVAYALSKVILFSIINIQ